MGILKGKVILDYPFDDGWYPYCRTSYALMVNSNTKYPEGAHEFIKYLLGEEGQTYAADGNSASGLPSSRAMADELKNYAERARYLPLKTEEIMSINIEEADMFFSGDKTLDAVCDLIQNRVQLYLDENR